MARSALDECVTEKAWFITGTSRGFGRAWTIAALARGEAPLPIRLDVTDQTADFAVVKQAHSGHRFTFAGRRFVALVTEDTTHLLDRGAKPRDPRRAPSGHRVGLRQVSLEVCCERVLPEACQELLVTQLVSAVPGKERP